MTPIFRPFIYGLVDPLEPKHVRYVGMASTNTYRPRVHANLAIQQASKHSHLFHWIRRLKSEGREYDVVVLREMHVDCSSRFLGLMEDAYITTLRQMGHNLTNVAKGGYGGNVATEDGQARQRAGSLGNKARTGKPHSEATKQKMREARLRFNEAHPEVVASVAAQQIGNTRALGYHHTDEAKAAISAGHLGTKRLNVKPHSKESRIQSGANLSKFLGDPANQDRVKVWRAKGVATRQSPEGRKRASDAAFKRHAWKMAFAEDPTLDKEVWSIAYDKEDKITDELNEWVDETNAWIQAKTNDLSLVYEDWLVEYNKNKK